MEKIGLYFDHFIKKIEIYSDHYIRESSTLIYAVVILAGIIILWLIFQKLKI
jgi:hypothetical protein